MQFKAREEGLLFQSIGDDLMIYDMERRLYHDLNPIAALVWKSCDGRKRVVDLTEVVQREISPEADEQTVWSALSLLDDANLLEGNPSEKAASETRRAFLKSAAASGRNALLAAAIFTITAPTVAAAQSNCSTAAVCPLCW